MAEKITRGSFLRRLTLMDRIGAPGETEAVSPARMSRVIRPPGSLLEPSFLKTCTRCDACFDACPPGIVVRASDPVEGVGTPVLNFQLSGCDHCGKCAEACAAGAIHREGDQKIGTALILQESCLYWAGGCEKCKELCPPEILAIQISEGSGIAVVPELCTGCGICISGCPTDPKSIMVQGRPAVPLAGHPRKSPLG